MISKLSSLLSSIILRKLGLLSDENALGYAVGFSRILLSTGSLFGVFYVIINALQAMGAACRRCYIADCRNRDVRLCFKKKEQDLANFGQVRYMLSESLLCQLEESQNILGSITVIDIIAAFILVTKTSFRDSFNLTTEGCFLTK